MKPVHRQRAILSDLLESLTEEQWNAETLCDGWDAGDMAAHLLVREHQPWASIGIVVPPLAGLHESAMAKKKADGRAALTEELRDGPPWLVTAVGPLAGVQVGEDYIHTEDIRRGGAVTVATTGDAANLDPDNGAGDPDIARHLWQAVSRFALMTFGGLKQSGILTLTDGTRSRSFQVGGRFARPAKDSTADEELTVTGAVGDLLLFTTGRSAVNVEVSGSEDLAAAVDTDGRHV